MGGSAPLTDQQDGGQKNCTALFVWVAAGPRPKFSKAHELLSLPFVYLKK